MRRSRLWMCALLAIAPSGCKQFNDQFAKVKDQFAKVRATVAAKIDVLRHRRPATGAAPTTPPPPAPPPAAPAPPAPAKPGARTGAARPRPAPEGPAAQMPERPTALRDVPYSSPFTGTIDPGMGEKDVYALWGPPADVRRQGEYTYLFFPNGCEHSCGTADVVMLQNGKVVDAILRWQGHSYSGQSSSPAATQPHVRKGGDTLTTKPPSTP